MHIHKKIMLASYPPVPENVTLLGKSIVVDKNILEVYS